MNNSKKINEIQNLQSEFKNHNKIIADAVLSQIMSEVDCNTIQFSDKVFEIYNKSNDKNACEELFYKLTGVEFQEYLNTCILILNAELRKEK